MSGLTFEVDFSEVQDAINKIGRNLHRVAYESARAGAIAAGLNFKDAVRKAAPIIKPRNVLLNTSDKYEKYRPGDVRDSIHFRWSKRGSDIDNGILWYVVGMGHPNPPSGKKYQTGWFAPFVAFDHMWVNRIVGRDKEDGGGYATKKLKSKPQLIKGNPFMNRGYSSAYSRSESLGKRACEDTAIKMLSKLGYNVT